jgi:hypothetical protein
MAAIAGPSGVLFRDAMLPGGRDGDGGWAGGGFDEASCQKVELQVSQGCARRSGNTQPESR